MFKHAELMMTIRRTENVSKVGYDAIVLYIANIYQIITCTIQERWTEPITVT